MSNLYSATVKMNNWHGIRNPFYRPSPPIVELTSVQLGYKYSLIFSSGLLGLTSSVLFAFDVLWLFQRNLDPDVPLFFRTVFASVSFIRDFIFVTNSSYLMRLIIRNDQRVYALRNRLKVLAALEAGCFLLHFVVAYPDYLSKRDPNGKLLLRRMRKCAMRIIINISYRRTIYS